MNYQTADWGSTLTVGMVYVDELLELTHLFGTVMRPDEKTAQISTSEFTSLLFVLFVSVYCLDVCVACVTTNLLNTCFRLCFKLVLNTAQDAKTLCNLYLFLRRIFLEQTS